MIKNRSHVLTFISHLTSVVVNLITNLSHVLTFISHLTSMVVNLIKNMSHVLTFISHLTSMVVNLIKNMSHVLTFISHLTSMVVNFLPDCMTKSTISISIFQYRLLSTKLLYVKDFKKISQQFYFGRYQHFVEKYHVTCLQMTVLAIIYWF